MGRLEGKTALITGVASGLGRSHALRLADDGAAIVGLDICAQIGTVPYPLGTPEELAEVAAEVGARGVSMMARGGDVRDRARLDDIVAEAIEVFGGIDIVVANAGIAPMLVEDRPQAWQDALDVNLTGVFNTIEACHPHMVERGAGGSIVIISSTAGLNGIGGPSHGGLGYAASKHGVVGLMRSYSNILASHRIRVNSLHPTGVNTRMITDDAIADFVAQDPILANESPNALPVEMIDPIDVSHAVAWLASDEARYVTGVTLPIDAGFTNRK